MSQKPWYRRRYLWLTLTMLLVLGGLWTWQFFSAKADRPVYLLGTVDRGDIVLQVTANGTLAAVTTVQVGSQVSGNIAELYADYNSEVKKGQLLAKLDPQLFDTQVQQAEANVQAAEMTLIDDTASIAASKANLEKTKVDVIDKQRKFQRQKELMNDNLISKDDFDTAQAAIDAAVAAQNAAEAELESTQARYKADEARLAQAQASLQTARVNLEHTTIYSPISGTIISRSVDRGQTVAASMQAPTLFTIGEDLTKMQVNTSIDEADVGRIGVGMEATFTVDAFPSEIFRGTINQIRLAPTTIQNVVTYNAIINVDNPQIKLKPGMTANVKILIDEVTDTLKIPNAALRFKPNLTSAEMENAFKQAGEENFWSTYKAMLAHQNGVGQSGAGGQDARAGAGRGDSGGGQGGAAVRHQGPASGSTADRQNPVRRVPLWTIGPNNSLRPIVVQLGLTDGVSTQLIAGNLKQNDKTVTGIEFDPTRAPTTLSNTNNRAPGFGGPIGMGGMNRGR
jgi:HlyD family secretion protein